MTARGAALDAGIELLMPMLAGNPVPGAGGRITTQAGVQRQGPDLDRRRAGLRAGPRRVAGTGSRAWRWWMPRRGRPNTSLLACTPGR